MCSCFSRRAFLTGSTATLAMGGLSGCDDVSLVSDAQVEELGLRTWSQITSQVPTSRNAELAEVTRAISTRLLEAAGERPRDWEVRVFASDQINAFAVPGRKIGLYEGMFRAARTPDQLAAVIGHEIGHIQAEHSKERLSAQIAAQQGQRLLARLLQAGDIEYADEIAAVLGVGVELGLVLPYNRGQEIEADRLGLFTMDSAGFRAEAAIDLWTRMAQLSKSRSPNFLATHPAPRARIDEIRATLPELA
ncbi:MAG: M48 family metallopeptidase [Shimia sp.]